MSRSLDLYFRDEYQATLAADGDGRLKISGPGQARARGVVAYYQEQAGETGADVMALIADRVRGLHWWTAETPQQQAATAPHPATDADGLT